MSRKGLVIILTLLSLLAVSVPALASQGTASYELWVVDQADAANGGDRLYVFNSSSWTQPERVVQLGERATGVGDGAGVRPHLLLFNKTHTHGVLANVASGHVYVIRASDQTVVASIDVGEQAHGAMPSLDDQWILVANQNGKKLARIQADFVNERFTYQRDADLDLGAMEDEGHPDNAPICPVMYVGNQGKAYVTLRGGGMYVVDTTTTPMQVVRSYGRDQIAPAGCGGIQIFNKVYVNSGTATSAHLYLFDATTDDLVSTWETTSYGTDAHGMAIVGDRYLWMGHRGEGDNILVFDTWTDSIVGTIDEVGAAPDLMDQSPDGSLVFVALRGPKALTGGAAAVGVTPGVAVLAPENGGATARYVTFIPLGNQARDTDVDPHALAIRRR